MEGTATDASAATTITVVEAGATAVFTPACSDSVHIVGSLRTTHETVYHNRITVISRLCQAQDIFSYVSPVIRIATMLSGQVHRITDMMATTNVSSQAEYQSL